MNPLAGIAHMLAYPFVRYAFLAAGHSLHISLLLAGYGVPLLLGRASFLPGGIAVVEVAMTALYGGLGVPADVAVVAVLTYRLIRFCSGAGRDTDCRHAPVSPTAVGVDTGPLAAPYIFNAPRASLRSDCPSRLDFWSRR